MFLRVEGHRNAEGADHWVNPALVARVTVEQLKDGARVILAYPGSEFRAKYSFDTLEEARALARRIVAPPWPTLSPYEQTLTSYPSGGTNEMPL